MKNKRLVDIVIKVQKMRVSKFVSVDSIFVTIPKYSFDVNNSSQFEQVSLSIAFSVINGLLSITSR